jgi:hypothetical protein
MKSAPFSMCQRTLTNRPETILPSRRKRNRGVNAAKKPIQLHVRNNFVLNKLLAWSTILSLIILLLLLYLRFNFWFGMEITRDMRASKWTFLIDNQCKCSSFRKFSNTPAQLCCRANLSIRDKFTLLRN